MNQTMLQHHDVYPQLYDQRLSTHFREVKDLYTDEVKLFESVIGSMANCEGRLTNKAIILGLINRLESTDDVVTNDIIRNTLEIVVHFTTGEI